MAPEAAQEAEWSAVGVRGWGEVADRLAELAAALEVDLAPVAAAKATAGADLE